MATRFTVVSQMSTVLGVRLCGSDCSATPHVASKTAEALRRSARTGRECCTLYFFLIAVVDILLVREFLHAWGPVGESSAWC